VTWRLALLPPESAPRLLADRIARDRANVVAALATVAEPWLPAAADPQLAAHALVAMAEEAARIVLADPADARIDQILANARLAFGQYR
jgi:hypothetical protein